MTLSELILKLRDLETRGDLPVYMLTGKYEFTVADVVFAESGPLPELEGVQRQVVPTRILLKSETTPEDSPTVAEAG